MHTNTHKLMQKKKQFLFHNFLSSRSHLASPTPARPQRAVRTIKCFYLLQGDRKEGRAKKVFKEVMAENFPYLAKIISLQIQEAEWALNMINPKKSIPRHIIIKLLDTDKEKKSLKVAIEKCHFTYRGRTMWMIAEL